MYASSRFIAGLAIALGAAAPAAAQIPLPKPTITSPTLVQPTFGRYRVVIQGISVAHETKDSNNDGSKDEIYVAAAFVLWNRRDGHLISTPNVIRTVEYGDIGGRNSGRVAAGSGSPSGGLWGGNGGDYAPSGFTAASTSTAGATAGALPMLIFEGGLSDSTEALLLAPSIWESDGIRYGFDNYANAWKTQGVGPLINSPVVQNQISGTNASTMMSLMVPANSTLQSAATALNVFAPMVGGFVMLMSSLSPTNMDRAIGLTEYQNLDQYQDRIVVITHEKLVSLPVGGGVSLTIPYAEPYNNILNGLYQLYVRVERIQ